MQTFISYRREEMSYAAGRLDDRLVQRFGRASVFMDINSIELGVDFRERIEKALTADAVLLVLIDRGWLNAKGSRGGRRIDDPHDPVHFEIATAMKRGARVVPILVDGAVMPAAEDLPADIAPLVDRNGIDLRCTRFDSDVADILDRLAAFDDSMPVVNREQPKPTTEVPALSPKATPAEPPLALLGKWGLSRRVGLAIATITVAGTIAVWYGTVLMAPDQGAIPNAVSAGGRDDARPREDGADTAIIHPEPDHPAERPVLDRNTRGMGLPRPKPNGGALSLSMAHAKAVEKPMKSFTGIKDACAAALPNKLSRRLDVVIKVTIDRSGKVSLSMHPPNSVAGNRLGNCVRDHIEALHLVPARPLTEEFSF